MTYDRLLHPPYKRTGEKQDGRTILEQDRTGENGRARMDGRQLFGVFLLKNIGKTGENSRKKLDGRQKIVVGGRAIFRSRPFIRAGVHLFFENFMKCRDGRETRFWGIFGRREKYGHTFSTKFGVFLWKILSQKQDGPQK